MVSNGSPVAAGKERLITDFSSASPGPGWYVVNDNVMGGRSEGGFQVETGALYFSGRTNTRGGGFSSIRTQPMALDLSRYTGIRLRVKGDGRRYTWRLSTAARWRGREVAYWAGFDTVEGEWVLADIPFTRFVPRFRGKELDGPALEPAQIRGMGLMIYDGRDGPFALQLASISAFADEAFFTLDDYRWDKRILVLGAPDENDAALESMRRRIAASSEQFVDRDMVLVTLMDEGVSNSGDRQLSAAEVAALRDALGMARGSFALRLIGKDGTIKLATDKAMPVAEIYSLIDTMPMRRQEMQKRE